MNPDTMEFGAQTVEKFHVSYNFEKDDEYEGSIHVLPTDNFSYEKGYGFLTEEAKEADPRLKIDEINAGLSPQYWYADAKLIKPVADNNGVHLEQGVLDGGYLPLTFVSNVPKAGNYKVTINIQTGAEGIRNLSIFSGRRRLEVLKSSHQPHEICAFVFNVNVCDIIPRGHEEVFEDKTLDITVIGSKPTISSITIEENDSMTVFICGDSTVTDQPCCYPYFPESSYCGWGQFFTYFTSNLVAVSNHSHSGLTTESFRSEGHYDIVKKNIKPGDFCLFQFGHNDQKLPHLAADTGYSDNLRTYIDEIREMGAYPVIVTPLARNTWRGSDGTYNDLLEDHANACIKVAAEKKVPLLDLHLLSMNFVKKLGLNDAERFYHPKDYTHSNDYGAYTFAAFVALEVRRQGASCPIPMRSSLVGQVYDKKKELNRPLNMDDLLDLDHFVPPAHVADPVPPEALKNVPVPKAAPMCKVEYTDLDSCKNKDAIVALAEAGFIHETTGAFNPTAPITRIDAINMATKAAKYVPVNVYNDMFTDVVGHEWYAGVVECAYANDMVDEELLSGKTFKPMANVTAAEMVSFCVNAYRSKFVNSSIPKYTGSFATDAFLGKYIDVAAFLGYIGDDFDPKHIISKEEAVLYIKKLMDRL